MRLQHVRIVRRWNTVSTICSLIVCLSGIDEVLRSQRYWLGAAMIAVGLVLLTISLNIRPEKGRRRVMPKRFEELAEYNAAMHPNRWVPEVFYLPDGTQLDGARIEAVDVDRSQYSDEHHARMATLQAEFKVWERAELERRYPDGDLIDMPGGGVLVFPEGVRREVGMGTDAFVDEMLKLMTDPNVQFRREPKNEE